MKLKTTQQRYREYLDTLPLSTLRILGRQEGVGQASSNNKDALIESIIDLLTGKAQPAPRSNRGAPVKQTFLDPSVRERLEEIRRQGSEDGRQIRNILEVASGRERDPFDSPVYTGILEITRGGYGFIRARGSRIGIADDVFVPAPMIHALSLREGDFVACTAKPQQADEPAEFGELLSVNGLAVGKYERRPDFDSLGAVYPEEKIVLSQGNPDISLRVIDLFAPLGKGQRALIAAPPSSGKTRLLKSIANAIYRDHPELVLMIFLVDERPEEVTELIGSVRNAQVVFTTFDRSAEEHVREAHLVIEHAKRLAEHGKDVVVLVDSLTRLARAYNSLQEYSGKALSATLDARALTETKRFFCAARNTQGAGSITMLATILTGTESAFDEAVCEGFRGTENMDIVLSRALCDRRVYPAIDLCRSGTRRELLTDDERSALCRMRESGVSGNTEEVLEMMRRTADNQEFIARLPELLRVRKGSKD